MKYYMGIDNGGTTTKAALYREDGFCAGVAFHRDRHAGSPAPALPSATWRRCGKPIAPLSAM